MRCTILVATCALAVFAAPVPEPEPIFKSGGTGCARVVAGVCVATGKREVGTALRRSPGPAPFDRGSHPRAVEDISVAKYEADGAIRNEGRSPKPTPFGRGSHPRDVATSEEGLQFEARGAVRSQRRSPAPAPFDRGSHPRDLELDEEDVEARAIRNQGKRSEVDVEVRKDESFEARSVRGPENRSAEPLHRNPDSRRAAEPINRINGRDAAPEKRTAEAEPGTVRPSNRAVDDDETIEARSVRGPGLKRTAAPEANPGSVRGSN